MHIDDGIPRTETETANILTRLVIVHSINSPEIYEQHATTAYILQIANMRRIEATQNRYTHVSTRSP